MVQCPVVLIHGWFDRPDGTGLWDVAERVLEDCGINYFTPHIPPHGSIAERTEALIKEIACQYPGRAVHLFGSSMGGLNARDVAFKASKKYLGFRVKTVTTFGSPHRGLEPLDHSTVRQGVESVTSFMADLQSLTGTDFGACRDLSASAMRKFNSKTPDADEVAYFSWTSKIRVATPATTLVFAATRLFGDTDGMVNVDSAIWGTHLGTLNGVDHYALTKRPEVIRGTVPHLEAAERGETEAVKVVDNNFLKESTSHIESVINSGATFVRHAVNEVARQVLPDDARQVVNGVTRTIASDIPQATFAFSLFFPRLMGQVLGVKF